LEIHPIIRSPAITTLPAELLSCIF